MSGPIGGEFVSLVRLCVTSQKELAALDKKNSLLRCKVRDDGGSVSYGPAFGSRYHGIPLNRALEMYHAQLEDEISRL